MERHAFHNGFRFFGSCKNTGKGKCIQLHWENEWAKCKYEKKSDMAETSTDSVFISIETDLRMGYGMTPTPYTGPGNCDRAKIL